MLNKPIALKIISGFFLIPGIIFSPLFCKKEIRDTRPNIIFLLTDDQRWDALSCMGTPVVQTPNIDKLAQEGVLFENVYVTTSICCASRASIFAGQYASRTGIHDFSTNFSREALINTYPLILRNAGYYTGFIGKFGVGNALPDTAFDYWKGIPGQPVYEHKDEKGNIKHLTRIISEQIMEFLDGCNKNKPFCLSVSFKAPHVQDGDPRQFIYDQQYKDLFKDDSIPVPVTADDKYFMAFPEQFRINNEGRKRWEIRFATSEMYQESVKGYYRLIYGVDVVVGKLMNKLSDLGFADNTVIIFSGDNGFYLGEHGLAGKWYGHEESIRVPFIVRDPRLTDVIKGIRRKEIALNIDIAPTILGICGEEIPDIMQGQNLMNTINGKAESWRKDFLYEHLYDVSPAVVYIPKSEGLVSLDYKYLLYIDFDPVFEELYDLRQDPHETRNLATDPGQSPLLDSLRQRYQELKKIYQ